MAQRTISDNYVRIFHPIGQFIDEKFSKKLYPTLNACFAEVIDDFIYNDGNELLSKFLLVCLLLFKVQWFWFIMKLQQTSNVSLSLQFDDIFI